MEEGPEGPHEIVLSEESPLHNRIKYGNESTYGYEVVNTKD